MRKNYLGNLKRLPDSSEELTPEKAYILGVVGPGDGFIITKNCGVGLSVVDKDFANKFKFCLEKVYGHKCRENILEPTGFGINPRWGIRLYSKNVVKDLMRYGVKFNEKNWSIPSIVKRASLDIKHSYVAGFADSQGSVHKREVLMFSQNGEGIKEFNTILLRMGLRSSIQERKDGYVLSIHSRNSLEYFHKNIEFSIDRKQNKLSKILSNYKRHCVPKELIDLLNPKIKNYLDRGYSQRKTARLLGISQNAVRNRIYGGKLK
jgi:hypothetical protein